MDSNTVYVNHVQQNSDLEERLWLYAWAVYFTL